MQLYQIVNYSNIRDYCSEICVVSLWYCQQFEVDTIKVIKK